MYAPLKVDQFASEVVINYFLSNIPLCNSVALVRTIYGAKDAPAAMTWIQGNLEVLQEGGKASLL